MVIQCPGCQTKYDLPHQKLGKGPTQMRCSRCNKTFVWNDRSATSPPSVELVTTSKDKLARATGAPSRLGKKDRLALGSEPVLKKAAGPSNKAKDSWKPPPPGLAGMLKSPSELNREIEEAEAEKAREASSEASGSSGRQGAQVPKSLASAINDRVIPGESEALVSPPSTEATGVEPEAAPVTVVPSKASAEPEALVSSQEPAGEPEASAPPVSRALIEEGPVRLSDRSLAATPAQGLADRARGSAEVVPHAAEAAPRAERVEDRLRLDETTTNAAAEARAPAEAATQVVATTKSDGEASPEERVIVNQKEVEPDIDPLPRKRPPIDPSVLDTTGSLAVSERTAELDPSEIELVVPPKPPTPKSEIKLVDGDGPSPPSDRNLVLDDLPDWRDADSPDDDSPDDDSSDDDSLDDDSSDDDSLDDDSLDDDASGDIPDAPTWGGTDSPAHDWSLDDDELGRPGAESGGTTKIVGIVMLAVLVVGGLLFLFVAVRNDFDFNRDMTSLFRTAFTGESSGVSEMSVVRQPPRLITLQDGRQALWVHASVRNESFGTKRNIRVKASVVDPRNQVVFETEVPCGLVRTEAELSLLTRDRLAAEYRALESSRPTVAPRTDLPCAVVFLSEQASRYQPTSHDLRLVVVQADPVREGLR